MKENFGKFNLSLLGQVFIDLKTKKIDLS